MSERLDSTNNGIAKVVNQTLCQITKAKHVASECISDLSGTQRELIGYSDINEFKGVVSIILSNTQTLTSTSEDLKSEVEKSSIKIVQLESEPKPSKKLPELMA